MIGQPCDLLRKNRIFGQQLQFLGKNPKIRILPETETSAQAVIRQLRSNSSAGFPAGCRADFQVRDGRTLDFPIGGNSPAANSITRAVILRSAATKIGVCFYSFRGNDASMSGCICGWEHIDLGPTCAQKFRSSLLVSRIISSPTKLTPAEAVR